MNNIWQQPLVDIGGPFSPEQNKGGRFLILPPGYNGPMPAISYHVVKSDTNTVVFLPAGGSPVERWFPETTDTGSVASLHADPEFRAAIEASRDELKAARARGLQPTRDCQAEADALMEYPPLAPWPANK